MSSGLEKVLIVAGKASPRSRLRRTLESFGFDVGEAPNNEIALRCLRLVDYEAILLDFPVFGAGDVAITDP